MSEGKYVHICNLLNLFYCSGPELNSFLTEQLYSSMLQTFLTYILLELWDTMCPNFSVFEQKELQYVERNEFIE